MCEDEKVGLTTSDEGSYYQKWSDHSDFELDETAAIGSRRQKIESRKVKGFVKNWELDESDTEEWSDSLNIIDAQLIQEALKGAVDTVKPEKFSFSKTKVQETARDRFGFFNANASIANFIRIQNVFTPHY